MQPEELSKGMAGNLAVQNQNGCQKLKELPKIKMAAKNQND